MEEAAYRERYSQWLVLHGAALRSLPELLDSFCRFLTAEGYAIHRCNLATDTIHPQMTGVRHVWFAEAIDPGPINPGVLVARRQYRVGDALIDEIFFNATSQESPQYKASPFYKVERLGELYEEVGPDGGPQPYPVFDDLAQQGCTAYFGLKLRSFAGMLQKVGLASRRPGGLTPVLIANLRWTLELLTLHINTLIEASIKDTLARVYLGRDPGLRVSQGMIAVGNVVALEGAIWFSDLRGFTSTSERLTPEELVETLNTYFAALVGPIYAEGGEILKYIGDAILAIFPTGRLGGAAPACQAALAAVRQAQDRLDEINAQRAPSGLDELHHGVGLHYGEARYGNVGSQERLDFTLIGREVNVASRIEGLTSRLDRSPLCSQAFADAAEVAMEPIGLFALKGVRGEVMILSPQPEIAVG